ncbi:MAG: hypothetical protein NTZ49_02415 [Candidatus Parcubacteria bacterium]|nr:hypothetical protein [Candidatus Parcubacteria bacterium]
MSFPSLPNQFGENAQRKKAGKLRPLESLEPEQIKAVVVSEEDLEEICDLEVPREETNRIVSSINWLTEIDEIEPGHFYRLLYDASTRNVSEELPIKEKTFRYRRNLNTVKKLRPAAYKLLNDSSLYKKENNDEMQKVANDLATFIALELKKAYWLEKEFYPIIFDKVLKTARAEVTQYLIKEKNLRKLDSFPDISSIPVRLVDILNYDLAGNPPDSAGVNKGYEIQVAIPSHFTDKDEWRVFWVVVHELVHSASYKNYERLGLHQNYNDPDFKEVNEAVTEMVTFFIMRDHLTNFKTSLMGERNHPLYLSNMAYSEYTALVKETLQKVPFKFFSDAMFNQDGLETLRKEFAKAYGNENALAEFALKLKNLFKPRAAKKKIINFQEASRAIAQKKLRAKYQSQEKEK